MTYTEQIDLENELERLREQKEMLAEQTARLESGDPLLQRLESRGSTLDKHITGVKWALEDAHTDAALPTRDGSGRPCPVWDDDVDAVTFKALSGEFEMIEDEVGSEASEHGLTNTTGLARLRTIAYGTAEAPYHDADADVDERIKTVQQLPTEFKQWAESVIVDISTLGNGPEQSFAAMVREHRTSETETTPGHLEASGRGSSD